MIVCYTLVDITQTGQIHKPKTPDLIKPRNQQRNFETFLQCISMRTQPFNITEPITVEASGEHFDFGSYYMGPMGFEYKLWSFSFGVENFEYTQEILQTDFDMVPIITGLNETAPLDGLIRTKGTKANTYFRTVIEETI